jgi:hypothetical protein
MDLPLLSKQGEKAVLIGPTCLADIQKGATVEGDSGSDPNTLPDWMDEARYKRVKRFFEKHALSLGLSWHGSLCIGFAMDNLLEALEYTHDSDTPAKAAARYADTGKHLVAWHLGDIFDNTSKAYQSLQGVRSMHSAVRKDMEAHLAGKFMTQYDMASVQTGFMGAITTWPTKFGLSATDEELEDYVFFWKCVGRQLGIADDFNLCAQGRATGDKITEQLMDQVVVPDYNHPPADYNKMAEAYIDGINLGFGGAPILSVKSTVALDFWVMDKPVFKMSVADNTRYYAMRLLLLAIGHFPGFELVGSNLMIRCFQGDPPPVELLSCPHPTRSRPGVVLGTPVEVCVGGRLAQQKAQLQSTLPGPRQSGAVAYIFAGLCLYVLMVIALVATGIVVTIRAWAPINL